ncbi:hypothetical protein TV39_08775 [Arthrobacter sp. SPG23]|uniref:hypothetical protein n=1 Tax=Arthrobacter sp. SPG23 TaxID=1610703 RepID=UPI0005BB6CEA|nr:hypothetical protein [Arthrobacter sp. SPG23]KIS27821.1 hypothetical protein TV39_08775 [Arthrobacter sp. SPG23]
MLGFLANLRDMKTSLSSGMILLLCLWLIFGNNLATIPADESLAGNLRRLSEYLGVAGTLAVITFGAYLLGMVVTSDQWFSRIATTMGLKSNTVSEVSTDRFRAFLEDIIDHALDRLSPIDVVDLVKAKSADAQRVKHYEQGPAMHKAAKVATANHIVDYVLNDLSILAVQLHSAKDKTWEKYDKASTEADFRSGLIGPLIIFGGVLAWRLFTEGHWVQAIATIIATFLIEASLLSKATKKRREANEELLHAVIIGDIEVAPIQALKSL